MCIRDRLDSVDTIAPFREFNYEARFQEQMLEVRLVGLEPDYAKTNRLEIAAGRFIDQTDMDKTSNVCVLGAEVAQKLFRFESPIGKSIQVANRFRFRIIGVVAEKMSSAGVGSSLSAEDFNRDIYIPLTTDHTRIGDVLFQEKDGERKIEKIELSQLTVRVKEVDDVKKTASAIKNLLLATHSQEDFRVTVPLDLLEQRKACLLYTSPSPRDRTRSRMPSSA